MNGKLSSGPVKNDKKFRFMFLLKLAIAHRDNPVYKVEEHTEAGIQH